MMELLGAIIAGILGFLIAGFSGMWCYKWQQRKLIKINYLLSAYRLLAKNNGLQVINPDEVHAALDDIYLFGTKDVIRSISDCISANTQGYQGEWRSNFAIILMALREDIRKELALENKWLNKEDIAPFTVTRMPPKPF